MNLTQVFPVGLIGAPTVFLSVGGLDPNHPPSPREAINYSNEMALCVPTAGALGRIHSGIFLQALL